MTNSFFSELCGPKSVLKTFLHSPTKYEKYIRRVFIHWFMAENVSMEFLKVTSPADQFLKDHDYCHIVYQKSKATETSFSKSKFPCPDAHEATKPPSSDATILTPNKVSFNNIYTPKLPDNLSDICNQENQTEKGLKTSTADSTDKQVKKQVVKKKWFVKCATRCLHRNRACTDIEKINTTFLLLKMMQVNFRTVIVPCVISKPITFSH